MKIDVNHHFISIFPYSTLIVNIFVSIVLWWQRPDTLFFLSSAVGISAAVATYIIAEALPPPLPSYPRLLRRICYPAPPLPSLSLRHLQRFHPIANLTVVTFSALWSRHRHRHHNLRASVVIIVAVPHPATVSIYLRLQTHATEPVSILSPKIPPQSLP